MRAASIARTWPARDPIDAIEAEVTGALSNGQSMVGTDAVSVVR